MADCGQEPPTQRLVVVLVDPSQSISDAVRAEFQRAWPSLIEQLRNGDRVVVVRISELGYPAFSVVDDVTLAAMDPWSENHRDYEQRAQGFKDRVRRALTAATSVPAGKKTPIMDAILSAGRIVSGQSGPIIILLCSDMLEDAEAVDFERDELTESYIERIIDRQQQRGRMADLHGANVHVVGATASTTARALAIERFWRRYLEASNARLAKNAYNAPRLVVE
jgi:hypothetical protein